MKKFFVIVSLLLVTVILFGCQGKTDNSTVTQNQLPPQEYNKTFTLQGKVMDAVTGVAIGSDPVDPAGALQMFLIQGDADRGPTKLHTDPNDLLVGEYSFSGIPADRSAGEAMFKVVVKRAGYQDFAANVNFDALISTGTVNLDGTLNKIGNIYLFPIGSVPGTVHVHVRNAALVPVPGATVLLQQNVANNTVTAITTGDRLVPVGGLYPSMTATTDADGVATFSGANLPLVLGGSYNAVVEAIEFQGAELASTSSGAFIIGTDTLHQNVTMDPAGLSFFATSASNQVPGTITPSGVLTLSFNEPIALTTTGFNATGLASDGTTTTFLVQAVLSPDFKTMTLTPDSAITGTTSNIAQSVVTYVPVNGVNDTPFILQISQTNSGFTFGAGTINPLINNTTGVAVSNVVRQIGF